MAAVWGRLRLHLRVVIRQKFWLFVGFVMLIGVVGDAVSRGWWSHAIPFLAVWWAWFLIGMSAVAVVLRLAWWLWWGLPRLQVDRLRLADPKDRGDAEDNFRKTAGQLLGGAAVLLGAGFAYVQFMQQQQATHDLLISNQVSKGFELLGNKDDKIEQRLGGIYALEGVMNGSEQYHQPVLETLCAFVRNRTGAAGMADPEMKPVTATIGGAPKPDKLQSDLPPPAADVRAALRVIGRRSKGAGGVDLTGAHIPQSDLTGANLSDANLFSADLTGARLSRANLENADLRQTYLTHAYLIRADLFGAYLTAADLTAAVLVGADLTGANLSGAVLSGADLSDANLSSAYLSPADLTRALLFGANLTGANLSGAVLSGAHLSDADLTGADLRDTKLDSACGDNVKGLDKLVPPLQINIESCPSSPVPPPPPPPPPPPHRPTN